MAKISYKEMRKNKQLIDYIKPREKEYLEEDEEFEENYYDY